MFQTASRRGNVSCAKKAESAEVWISGILGLL
jgi:hypothetical protein